MLLIGKTNLCRYFVDVIRMHFNLNVDIVVEMEKKCTFRYKGLVYFRRTVLNTAKKAVAILYLLQ